MPAYDALGDLNLVTLPQYQRFKVQSIAQKYQDLIFMKRMFRKNAGKVQLSGGTTFKFQVMTKFSATTKHIGAYEADTYVTEDVMAEATIPFRMTSNHAMWDIGEIDWNRGDFKINDLKKIKIANLYGNLTETMEEVGWGKPVDSTDTSTPWGMGMFIVKNATKGWNGAAPAGFADCAGLTHANWRNYTFTYSAFTFDDLIDELAEAIDKLNFKPYEKQEQMDKVPPRFVIATDWTGKNECRKLAVSQNDQNGNDLVAREGQVTINGVPIVWAPFLDTDTSHPFWLIDFEHIFVGAKSGWLMKEKLVSPVPDHHNVEALWCDTQWGVICTNRRSQGIGYQV